MLSEKLPIWLKESESERLSFKLFFGQEIIETLVAFANSHGGIILIGISEHKLIKGVENAEEEVQILLHDINTRTTPRLNPKIEIIDIKGKTIVYLSITEYPIKPVAYDGKYFKRLSRLNQELSVREALDLRQQSIDSHWDCQLRKDKTIADISFIKLQKQIEIICKKKQSHIEEPLSFLRKYGLVEGEAITNACWLMFMPEEDPKTTIEIRRFSSPTVVSDTLILKSDLFTEADEAMRFICKHICKKTEKNELVQWKFPVEAIKELVINMIIHRDYTADYNSIIKIFDGYIEFYNPGALPDNILIKRLLSGEYTSKPRNCRIAEMFKDSGMFEEYGTGIYQINNAFKNRGLRPPEYIKMPGRLIIKAYGDTSTGVENKKIIKNDITNNSIQKKQNSEKIDIQKKIEKIFSDREQQIMGFIFNDNKIPLNEIANKLNVSKRTILRDIDKLKKEKILERIGGERNGFWKINQ